MTCRVACTIALAGFLAGCTNPGTVVKVRIKNSTDQVLKVRAKSWIYSRTLIFKPGEYWEGTVDKRFVGPQAEIEVEEFKE